MKFDKTQEMIRKILLWIAGLLGIALVALLIAYGPILRDFVTMDVISEESGIYYLMDYGGNSGLIVGDSAAVLIDTKFSRGSKKLKKFVDAKVGSRPLYVINTHYHQDHIGGNQLFTKAEVIAGNYGKELWKTQGSTSSLPDRWISEDFELNLGSGNQVRIIYAGQNHTREDLLVYSEKYKALFTGDIYTHLSHPVMQKVSLANSANWEATLRSLALGDLEIETVVPGHGDLAKKTDLIAMANYFDDLRMKPWKQVKKKYRSWDKLPFLASLKLSRRFLINEENIEP